VRHSLRNPFIRTRPIGPPQKIAEFVYSIPCECGGNYIAETGRPWAVRLREHRRHFKVGYLENPNQHSIRLKRNTMYFGNKLRVWRLKRIQCTRSIMKRKEGEFNGTYTCLAWGGSEMHTGFCGDT
jgi:hypothetical protein